ncbi:hypothetical protein NQ176_g1271 [Zarea fungicola]|uniref:Uncharacterized protein n=1 Tax=Zarea fungicola TaxID=93591 RepID=A0ACC1NUM3_9HYPO|nr:hypothetical protein NQ176_g1271 [Lecanicillium fungicola]
MYGIKTVSCGVRAGQVEGVLKYVLSTEPAGDNACIDYEMEIDPSKTRYRQKKRVVQKVASKARVKKLVREAVPNGNVELDEDVHKDNLAVLGYSNYETYKA